MSSNKSPSDALSTSHTTTTTTITDGSVVRLRDVDDFVGLSAACVNPLFTTTTASSTQKGTTEGDLPVDSNNSNVDKATDIVIPKKRRQRNRPTVKSDLQLPENAPEQTTTKPFAAATMADCLACSGCVTTAETVLLEQHTTDVFRNKLETASSTNTQILLMISPASFADILRHCLQQEELEDLLQYQLRFVALLSEYLGIHHVLDGNLALLLSRKLAADEFCKAYRYRQEILNTPKEEEEDGMQSWTNVEKYERNLVPSRPISHTQTQYWIHNGDSVQVVEENQVPKLRDHQALPLISSSCPAVVCVVEKSKHELVRHLSTVVSPMMTTAALIVNANEKSCLMTIAVMPCHDKKLEASRTDFMQHTVDMVITTRELVDVLLQTVREKQKQKQKTEQLSEATDEQNALLDWMKEQLLLVNTTNSVRMAKHCIIDDITNITAKTELKEREDGDSFFYAPSSLSSSSSLRFHGGQNDASQREETFVLGSGGYADYIFRSAARELFGITKPSTPIWRPIVVTPEASMKSGGSIRSRRRAHPKRREYYQSTLCRRTRNGADLNEYDSYYVAQSNDDEADGEVVLRFAIAYGMQTAQPLLDDLVTKHCNEASRSSLSKYHYVELMACGHGGCLNGGGQIVTQRETPAETRDRVRVTQDHFAFPSIHSDDNVAKTIMNEQQDQFSLYTRYHIVPPMQHAWGAAAGVAIEDTQW